jgi:predicted flap endonuclease-1-like 5' DNA nuclease
MSTIAAFFFGLLIGWLVEWLIDWWYWRRKYQDVLESEERCRQKISSLEGDRDSLKVSGEQARQNAAALHAELATLKLEHAALLEKSAQAARLSEAEAVWSAPPLLVPDDLEVIVGIGPVIAKKLNKIGIHTFEQLAAQTPDFLRQVLGDVIQRLADEASLIEQARQLALRKRGGGEQPK